jgi:putative effector of murein hydrolase
MNDSLLLLQQEITAAQSHLQLIAVRKSQYVLTTEIPLQLIREEEQWQARLAALQAQLAAWQQRPVDQQHLPLHRRWPGWRWPQRVALLGSGVGAGVLLTIGCYALYLWTVSLGAAIPALVGVSLVIIFAAGCWLGWLAPESWRFDRYLGVALVTALLNSLGVVLCLALYLRERGIQIDWNRVFELYFIPSLLLITMGRIVGSWLRHRELHSLIDDLAPPQPAGTISPFERMVRALSGFEVLFAVGALLVAIVTVWLALAAARN